MNERWTGFQDAEAERLIRLAYAEADGARAEALALEALARDPNALPAHMLLAERRLPGPDYLAQLARLHSLLEPRVYVEIGVGDGSSLALAHPGCEAVGVDPDPQVDEIVIGKGRLATMTSDAFFAACEGPLGWDLAFVDGDHHFAQALRDFVNLERHAAPGAVMAIHDTLPLDEATASEERRTTFHSGTCWKLVAALRALRPDLRVRTIAAAPTGLTLVRGLDPASTVLSSSLADIVAFYAGFGWAEQQLLRQSVPSTAKAVDDFLDIPSDCRFEGVRAGRFVRASVLVPPGVRALPLSLSSDGTWMADATARAEIGREGRARRLAFEVAAPDDFADGAPHRLALHRRGSGEWLAELTVPLAQAKPYHDVDTFLAWAFHHRILLAPFTPVDRSCLAWFDWTADHLSAKPSGRFVSVVMPFHDDLETVGRAAASVVAQRHANWELLVVDDGSAVSPAALLDGFGDRRIRLLRLDVNQGPSAARNAALEVARGDLIAYLDADNWWDPRYLGAMAAALDAAPGWDSAYCGQYLHRAGSERPRAVRMGPFNPALIDHANYIDINCFIHRRADGLRFDPEMRRIEDWELVLRLAERRAPLFVPVVLSSYLESAPTPEQHAFTERAATRFFARGEAPDCRAFTVHVGGEAHRLWSRPSSGLPPPRGISIVIPSYEVADLLRQCVERVFATIPDDGVEVIICDNGSSPPALAELDRLEARFPRVRVDRSPANRGFTAAVNRGLGLAAPGHDVVLLNNDALVTDGWLEALADVAAREPRVGVVVPRQMLLAGTPTATMHVPTSHDLLEVDVSLSDHHGNVLAGQPQRPDGLIELGFAPFFCVLLTRAALDAVGPLDERRGRHYRSDTLFCEAVRKVAGLRIVYTPRAKVYHLLMRATQALRDRDPAEHAALYDDNRLPGDAPLIWEL